MDSLLTILSPYRMFYNSTECYNRPDGGLHVLIHTRSNISVNKKSRFHFCHRAIIHQKSSNLVFQLSNSSSVVRRLLRNIRNELCLPFPYRSVETQGFFYLLTTDHLWLDFEDQEYKLSTSLHYFQTTKVLSILCVSFN